MIDLAELEAKARAATPGPWIAIEQTAANAAYISAASPDVVLKLIAALRDAAVLAYCQPLDSPHPEYAVRRCFDGWRAQHGITDSAAEKGRTGGDHEAFE